MEQDNTSKITKVIYNILNKKIPKTVETYKKVLESIGIKTIKSAISDDVKTKLENLYIKPPNIEQIMFIFIGSLDQYPGITIGILDEFSQFIIQKKNLTTFRHLQKLKTAFGDEFNSELDITTPTNAYLYSKIYFIDKYITKINTITEVENIICSFIGSKIRTNTQIKSKNKILEVNKILIYSDCFVDDIIIKNIQSNIILTLQNNNYTLPEVIRLLGNYYVPKIIIKQIIKNIYANKFL